MFIKKQSKPNKTLYIILITLLSLVLIAYIVVTIRYSRVVKIKLEDILIIFAIGFAILKTCSDYKEQCYLAEKEQQLKAEFLAEIRKEREMTLLTEPIDNMDGHLFEQYVCELLSEIGYTSARVTRSSGDQGADVIAVNEYGEKCCFQCKRSSSRVSNSAVQEITAARAYYNCTRAYVVTNNLYTKSAYELALANNVELWDRTKLANMLYSVQEENQKKAVRN